MANCSWLLVGTAATVLVLSQCQAAPLNLPEPGQLNSNTTIQRIFSDIDRQLKRFSDLDEVIAEFTKPCRELKNISIAMANHCINYVSSRVSRATSYGAMGGRLAVDELWSLNNRTETFVQTLQHAFKQGGKRGALKAFAEIKDFLDMDEVTLRQIAADLEGHVEHKFETVSQDLQKRWPQDAEYIQDAERMLRPELHEKLRELLRLLGLAEGPVKKHHH